MERALPVCPSAPVPHLSKAVSHGSLPTLSLVTLSLLPWSLHPLCLWESWPCARLTAQSHLRGLPGSLSLRALLTRAVGQQPPQPLPKEALGVIQPQPAQGDVAGRTLPAGSRVWQARGSVPCGQSVAQQDGREWSMLEFVLAALVKAGVSWSLFSLGTNERPSILSCSRQGRGCRQTGWGGGVQSLTGACKDDRGGHSTPLARPGSSRPGGVAVAAEEATISKDQQLQGAVWGAQGSQGSRKG